MPRCVVHGRENVLQVGKEELFRCSLKYSYDFVVFVWVWIERIGWSNMGKCHISK